VVFIVCVNVLFLSNSQLVGTRDKIEAGVYRMCQCPLFKQFTTDGRHHIMAPMVFIVCVNVLFLSNSQLLAGFLIVPLGCLSYVSMSSF